METAQEVLKLTLGDVSRFVTLRNRLSSTAFNVAETPFLGWDKFKRTGFEYKFRHPDLGEIILIPNRIPGANSYPEKWFPCCLIHCINDE